MAITTDSALPVYALTAAFLGLEMVLVDAYSGVVRGGTKTTLNTEDAGTVSKGARVVPEDPDAVARVMRAHRNLFANGVPFLILGFLWVAMGADKTWATAIFGTFVAMRVVHAFAYIKGLQPWRSISFTVGQLALATMIVQIVRAAVAMM